MFSLFSPGKKPVVSKVIAILLKADWCEASKDMTHIFSNLQKRFDDREVLFVTLDFTDHVHRHQAAMLSNALGISEALGDYSGKTGLILTMTARGKNVFGQLTKKEYLKDLFKLVDKKLR